MDWKSHKHANKIAYHWTTREEVTNTERANLDLRMSLNYYGFWGNKVLHLYLLSVFFKRNIVHTTNELRFWGKILGASALLYFSAAQVDKILKKQLIWTVEHLHSTYGARIDTLQSDYLKNKSQYETKKKEKLQELKAKGKNVEQIK